MLARLPAPSASSQLIQCHLRLRIPVTRRCAFTFRRSYVTPGRPKGVVGEASKPVKRSTTTTKKAPSKTSTTAATKAKAAAAKKKQADAVKKEKAAAAKKKAAAKVKAAAAKKKAAAAKKAKKPVKATLTPEQKAKQTAKKEQAKQRVKLSELKAKALLGEPQKPYSVSAWSIFFAELHQKRSRTTLQESINVTKDAAKEFKTFTPEEREHYNQLAKAKSEAVKSTYKAWVGTHTPAQIIEANAARRALNKLVHTKSGKPKYSTIVDDRLPSRPISSYIIFTKDRHASGEFKGIATGDASKLIAKEWATASESEKAKYDALGKAELGRYAAEYTQVVGHPPASKAAAAAA